MKLAEIGKHLVVDPRVCHGQLTFKGTRVPVHTVLVYLAKGETIEEILADWPQLSREAVHEAMRLAADSLAQGYEKRKRAGNEPVYPRRPA